MRINSRGYWENNTEEGHGHDPNLMKSIINYLTNEYLDLRYKYGAEQLSLADVGCGTGYYTKELNKYPIFDCYGYDGNPHTKEIAGPEFEVIDFSKEIDFLEPPFIGLFDWVLCLEVGEHIPVEFEQVFLNNITSLADTGIILSWAIEGQGGDGHVNCRNNDYIISEMHKRNFILDSNATQCLREDASKYPFTGWWFKQTLMVFCRKH